MEIIRDTDTFVRLVVHGAEDLLVDLALDSVPGHPPTVTLAGPTYAPEELAGRKAVAMFDRAAAGTSSICSSSAGSTIVSGCCFSRPRFVGPGCEGRPRWQGGLAV